MSIEKQIDEYLIFVEEEGLKGKMRDKAMRLVREDARIAFLQMITIALPMLLGTVLVFFWFTQFDRTVGYAYAFDGGVVAVSNTYRLPMLFVSLAITCSLFFVLYLIARRYKLRKLSVYMRQIMSEGAVISSKCWGCGYDLRGGKVEKCPECGEVITFKREQNCGEVYE
ncbi:hypothetical protein JD969_09795 [Planctomycetota bacterium]|nr:hypothetical protein JD969_09795 [Planctomycetota bacterium]